MSKGNGKVVDFTRRAHREVAPIPMSPEDMMQVVDAAFAESFAGFTRAHNGTDWQWHVERVDEHNPELIHHEVCGIEKLASVAKSHAGFLERLIQFCKDASAEAPDDKKLVWSVMQNRDGKYRCQILIQLAPEKGKPPLAQPIASGESDGLSVAVAIAMFQATGVDLARLHRDLFPHRYLAVTGDLP